MIDNRIYSKVEFLKFANSNGFKLLTRSFEPSIKLPIIIVNRIVYETSMIGLWNRHSEILVAVV